MSKTMISVLVIFIVLILLSVPIAYGIGIAGLVGVFMDSSIPLNVVPQRLYSAIDSFTLLAVPFFIVAGDIMLVGGISKRLIKLAKTFVGSMKGGMAYVCFLASAFFGALSGSSNATTVAIGGLMYPEMLDANYKPSYAAAIGATAGSLGVLIPPSICCVLVGSTNSISVGSLFLYVGLCGVLVLVGYCVTVKLSMKKMGQDVKTYPKSSLKEKWVAIKEASGALLSPAIILGGMYSGLFTATEAAVVSIIYSLIISIFVYKEMTFKDFLKCLKSSMLTSGKVLFIAATAALLSWVISVNGFVTLIENWFSSMHMSVYGFLFVVIILYIILGSLMDTVPIVTLTTPIVIPVATAVYGISPLHIATAIVFNIVFGVITPPFGTDVFVANTYSKQPTHKIFADCKYFLIAGLIMQFLVTYAPLLFYYY